MSRMGRERGTAGSCRGGRFSQRIWLPVNAKKHPNGFLERVGPGGSQIEEAGTQPTEAVLTIQ